MTSEAELEAMYPHIPWRLPVPISMIGKKITALGCRFCIAQRGLKGSDVPDLPQTQQAFDKHMVEQHGGKAAA